MSAWARRVTAGQCGRCGRPRHAGSRSRCARCLVYARQTMRRRFGTIPWRPGSRGTSPLVAIGQ